MSVRNPIVLVNGTLRELPAGDTVAGANAATAFIPQTYSATAGQVTFPVTGGYVVGQVAVYQNGAKLLPADFTATNGTSIVLTKPAVATDGVEIVKWTSISITDAVAKSGDTMFGKLTITGIWDQAFEAKTTVTDQYSGPTLILNASGASANYAQTWIQHQIATGASDLTDTNLSITQRDVNGNYLRTIYRYSYKNSYHSWLIGDVEKMRLDANGLSLIGPIGLGATVDYGLAGQVMKSNGPGAAPSWGAAGGRTLLATATTTLGAANVTITGLPTGYDKWEIELDGLTPAATASFLNMALSADGTTFEVQTVCSGSYTTASSVSGVFLISQVSAAGVTKLAGGGATGGGNGGSVSAIGGRFISQTGVLTALRFLWNNATTFNNATGTIRVYGIK